MDRQLTYDTGPQPGNGGEPSGEGADRSGEDTDRSGVVAGPWRTGIAAGAGAFATTFAITYHLASGMVAVGYVGSPQPSRWVLTGLVMLGGHGARIEQDGEAIQAEWIFGFLLPVSALIPVVVLATAGFLLVRYLAEADLRATARTSARAGGTFLVSYVALATLLARLARWQRGEDTGGGGLGGGVAGMANFETISVSIDASFVLTVSGTVVSFVVLGGALALLTTFAIGSTSTAPRNDTDGDTPPDDGGDETLAEPYNGGDETLAEPYHSGDEPVAEPYDESETEGRASDDGRRTDRSGPSRGGAYWPPRRSVDPDRRYDPDDRYGDRRDDRD